MILNTKNGVNSKIYIPDCLVIFVNTIPYSEIIAYYTVYHTYLLNIVIGKANYKMLGVFNQNTVKY